MKSLASLLERGHPVERLIRRSRAPVIAFQRARALASLDRFSRGKAEPVAKRVLFDATYDNPNYWLRLALVRRALGTAYGSEAALTGNYSVNAVRSTLQRLGINEVFSIKSPAEPKPAHVEEAQRLVASVRTARDFLEWRFACGLPASDVFDGILKRQRSGTIDFSDVNLAARIADILRTHDAAAAIFDKFQPDIYVASHNASANTAYGAILWAAVSRGIEVLVPWGGLGELRFYRIHKWEDGYRWANVPTRDDIESLSQERADILAKLGQDYIAARLGGRTDDASAVYAYRRPGVSLSRSDIASKYGWNPASPIVAVYASIWFDNPHVFGMQAYTDFNDWLGYTIGIAGATRDINWLFKPHPSEFYYGGPTLADLLTHFPASPNVAICQPEWNGRAVLEAVDAVVTLHGTVGVEATAIGRPVLAAAPGWYDHLDFVYRTTTREHFAETLKTHWWDGVDMGANRRRAEVFAGWYASRSADGRDLTYGEDHEGQTLWRRIGHLVADRFDNLADEADDIRSWWLSGQPHYHTYRMRQAKHFAPSLTTIIESSGQ